MRQFFFSGFRLILLVLVLILSAALIFVTYFLWNYSVQQQQVRANSEFDKSIVNIEETLTVRIGLYVSALYAADAFISASDSVTRADWQKYVASLRLDERYPGISRLNYIEVVNKKDKQAYTTAFKNDKSVSSRGYPNFEIHPESDNDQLYLLKYIEPFEASSEANFGLDYSVDPDRRLTLEKARDTGMAVASPGIISVTTNIPIFFIAQPIYRKGARVETVAQRRAAITGFVMTTFRNKELFTDLFPGKSYDIDFQIYDTSRETLLFDYPIQLNTDNGLEKEREIAVPSGTWKVNFTAPKNYHIDSTVSSVPVFILLTGGLLTVLIVGTFISLLVAQDRAQLISVQVQRKLNESEGRYKLIFESLLDIFYQTDLERKITQITPSVEKALGYKPSEMIGKDAASFYVNPDDKDALLQALQTGNGSIVDFPAKLKHKDGKPVTFSLNAQILFDAEKKPMGVQGVLRDVSLRQAAEDELKARTKQLERLNRIMVDRELKMIDLKKQLAKTKK